MSSKNKSPKFYKKELEASLITTEWAEKCGITELDNDERAFVAKELNRDLTKTPIGPFLRIPYFNIENREEIWTVNYKAAEPLMVDGKPKKYLRPSGSSNYIYVPKFVSLMDLMNSSLTLHITEGEKKTICANIHGILTIGLNGVQNWKTRGDDGVSRPLDIFTKLNLKGRSVRIDYDSDAVSNKNVRKAEYELAQYLESLGAEVKVVRFPQKDDGTKVGMDDYIVEHGIERFKSLVNEAEAPSVPLDKESTFEEIESHLSNLKELTTKEKINKIKGAIPAIQNVKEKAIEEEYIKKISKSSGFSVKTVRAMFETTEKPETTTASNVITYDSETQHTSTLLKKIISALTANGKFFREGQELITISGNKRKYLKKDAVPATINNVVELKIDGRFRLLDQSLANAILYTNFTFDVPEISLFTNTVVYDDNWNISKPGYDKESKILYLPDEEIKDLKPRFTRTAIDEFLRDFPFKNEASKVNAIASLLTALNRHRFKGTKPFFAHIGNQPGLGKSLLAEGLIILITGKPSAPIRFQSNEYQMENLIAAAIQSTDILNFDNIKSVKDLESAPLESTITSETPGFRRFGKNDELIVKPNVYQVHISLNDAKLGDDLSRRMVPIEFWWKEDPSKRFTSKTDVEFKKWVKLNRKIILEELLGMVETWKKKGCPLSSKKARFSEWVAYIGGIIEANGISGFMDNYASASAVYTQSAQEASALFSENLNKWFKVVDLINLAKTQNCFRDVMMKSNPNVALGIALGKLAEKETPLPLPDGTTFILRQSHDPNDRKPIYFADAPQYLKTDEKGKNNE